MHNVHPVVKLDLFARLSLSDLHHACCLLSNSHEVHQGDEGGQAGRSTSTQAHESREARPVKGHMQIIFHILNRHRD